MMANSKIFFAFLSSCSTNLRKKKDNPATLKIYLKTRWSQIFRLTIRLIKILQICLLKNNLFIIQDRVIVLKKVQAVSHY